jgi:translation initiation factor 2A
MPAKAVLFDQRVRVLHDFGTGFHNTVLFNPQGRLILLAGFGNLAGKVDIHDRRSLSSVTTIDAANTSHCEWSPDGRFLLTATLSPRLRVDNGIKVWHCSGPLLHVQMIDELYQAGWRPTPLDAVPAFPQGIPPAPAPAPSVAVVPTAKPTPVKMGAYRPPGARGSAVSSVYKREEEGGLPIPRNDVPGAGAMSPNGRYSRSPMRNGRRHIPGAPTSPSPTPDRDGKRGKKKGGKDKGSAPGSAPGSGTATPAIASADTERGRPPPMEIKIDGPKSPLGMPADSVPPTPGGDSTDPIAKKVRNLNKKVRWPVLPGGISCINNCPQLKAIDELKEKAGRGERLEATQLKKIESEAEIRKELTSLTPV